MQLTTEWGIVFPLVKLTREGYDGRPRTEPCPFCHKTHSHSPVDGHRLPHCRDKDLKKVIDGKELLNKNGYVIKVVD